MRADRWRGRDFGGFDVAREDLSRWRDEVANVRVHGTTRRKPCELFTEERGRLLPLPEDPYELADWGLYRVRKDCHVHVRRNYYSVPHSLVGMKVLVRLTADELTVFAQSSEVARHRRANGEGEDVTDLPVRADRSGALPGQEAVEQPRGAPASPDRGP